MCGRWVHPDEAALEREWAIIHNWWQGELNFNVSPTATVPMVRLDKDGQREAHGARWGLIPSWWNKDEPPTSTFNARSEEAASKPMWRGPMKSCRCLLPALGWYEWDSKETHPSASGRKIKQPYFIRAEDELIGLAGLWSVWHPPDAEPLVTCTILTRQAAPSIASIHHRMPVVLPDHCFDKWLDPSATPADVQNLIAVARDDVSGYRVSTAVGNTRHNGPELIEEVPAG